MIDPLETIVVFCKDRMPIVEGRVAQKHRFLQANAQQRTHGSWPTPAAALEISYGTGGASDVEQPNQRPRISARCYGRDVEEAGKVYRALVQATRQSERQVILTSEGKALLYWLSMNGSPQNLFDPDVQVDFIQVYLDANVAETPIG